MPHSFGYRARTRDMFSRPFREQGPTKLSTYLIKYKVGDYVDIKCNPSIHKGMPFKNYHGRTGVIFNVTKRAVGVRVNKEVNGKIIAKMLHVRVEHILPSKCKQEVTRRIKENEAAKAANSAGAKLNLKRQPKQPKEGYIYEMVDKPETIQPVPFVDLV